MPPNDITLGELGRRIDRLESNIQTALKSIDDRMATSMVSREYYTGQHRLLEARVSDLEADAARIRSRRFAVTLSAVGALAASLGSLATVLVHVH